MNTRHKIFVDILGLRIFLVCILADDTAEQQQQQQQTEDAATNDATSDSDIGDNC